MWEFRGDASEQDVARIPCLGTEARYPRICLDRVAATGQTRSAWWNRDWTGMSADTVIVDSEEAVSWGQRLRPVAIQGFVMRLMHRDLFGVRVGVLMLIFPMFIATMALQVTSRQGWNHPPDSRYYLPMISRDMGHSLPDSIHIEQNVSPSWHIAPWYFADSDPTWQMVRTRILYPVLSIPFVWLWGLSGGSLAIPILGDVLFLWAIARVLQRMYGPAVAVIVAGLFSIVKPDFDFAWAGTDTLALGLIAVLVANLPIERRIGRANLAWIGIMTVMIALTRQVGVLAPAMAGAGWLWALVRERTWRNRWLGSLVVTAAVTLVIQALTMMLVKTDTAGIISRGQTTYWGVIRQFIHYLKVVTVEACTYMWHTDRITYALLIAAGVALLARFKSDAAAVFLGAACATYIITAALGFSAYMRYEMMMFPAAAIAAGELVSFLLGSYLVKLPEQPDSVENEAKPRFRPGLVPALQRTSAGRFLGLDLPRADRYRPQLLGGFVVLAVAIGVSAPGSWSSSAAAPATDSVAAAQGSQSYAVQPLARPGAEVTLKAAFDQASAIAVDKIGFDGTFDWVHDFRYRPLAPDQPGWAQRAKDGTYVIHVNSLGEDLDGGEAFGRAISLNRTVLSNTVHILTRHATQYGEDVAFTVMDEQGNLHQGTATTLYPIWNRNDPATVTSLVFDS
jgi:hypothetical protein